MDREAAHALARERCLKETTVRHLISVEGVMRALARRFGEDEDLWGLTGLFHDLDQDHTGDDAENHGRLAAGGSARPASTSASSTASSRTRGRSTGPT
jgi:putative nucleotidyltransferase with HDIG domain